MKAFVQPPPPPLPPPAKVQYPEGEEGPATPSWTGGGVQTTPLPLPRGLWTDPNGGCKGSRGWGTCPGERDPHQTVAQHKALGQRKKIPLKTAESAILGNLRQDIVKKGKKKCQKENFDLLGILHRPVY